MSPHAPREDHAPSRWGWHPGSNQPALTAAVWTSRDAHASTAWTPTGRQWDSRRQIRRNSRASPSALAGSTTAAARSAHASGGATHVATAMRSSLSITPAARRTGLLPPPPQSVHPPSTPKVRTFRAGPPIRPILTNRSR